MTHPFGGSAFRPRLLPLLAQVSQLRSKRRKLISVYHCEESSDDIAQLFGEAARTSASLPLQSVGTLQFSLLQS